MIGYIYILGTLVFTVFGQIVIKWRLNSLPAFPEGPSNKIVFLMKVLLDPYIFSGFVSAFIASMFWIATMTQFEITKAYPFMSLAPALVFLIGISVLGESFTWGKVIGLFFIALGIIITVKY